MKINNKKYSLTSDNFYEIETQKTQIVIGNTFNNNMNHFKGWKTRLNGKTKKTAHYTIDINGKVFEHFDPKYYSNFIGINDLDKQIISIVIENEGWLLRDIQKGEFIDWVGNIYKGKVFECSWRNLYYWTSYNEKQNKAIVELIKSICDRFKDIPLDIVSHNTKVDNINKYRGVFYRSNFSSLNTDPNPCLDYKFIKDNIEELNKIENE